MRRPLRLTFLVLVALPSFSFAAKPEPYTLTGKVVKIADGDTLTVLDGANAQHKIRLAGIDAPEKARLPIDDLGDTMRVAEVVQPDNSGHDFVRRVNSILFWARAVVFLE
jgi:endonuclease YncB( thermonuclease family)